METPSVRVNFPSQPSESTSLSESCVCGTGGATRMPRYRAPSIRMHQQPCLLSPPSSSESEETTRLMMSPGRYRARFLCGPRLEVMLLQRVADVAAANRLQLSKAPACDRPLFQRPFPEPRLLTILPKFSSGMAYKCVCLLWCIAKVATSAVNFYTRFEFNLRSILSCVFGD